MKLIVMGSGTSSGVPVIGCNCPVCVSTDEHDKRMRASLYIKGNKGERIVIDTGPEFRLQALRAGIKYIDFILLTHPHADHLHGLDDLRQFSRLKPVIVYGNELTTNDIRERFAYLWRKTQIGGGKLRIDLRTVSEPFSFENFTITPIPVKHGNMDILGWKIRETTVEAAYITDCSFISGESVNLLKNISCLILGALRKSRHETHFSFDEALETVKKIAAPKLSQVFFTHISDENSHKEISEYCMRWREKNNFLQTVILPAYDGLEVDI